MLRVSYTARVRLDFGYAEDFVFDRPVQVGERVVVPFVPDLDGDEVIPTEGVVVSVERNVVDLPDEEEDIPF